MSAASAPAGEYAGVHVGAKLRYKASRRARRRRFSRPRNSDAVLAVLALSSSHSGRWSRDCWLSVDEDPVSRASRLSCGEQVAFALDAAG